MVFHPMLTAATVVIFIKNIYTNPHPKPITKFLPTPSLDLTDATETPIRLKCKPQKDMQFFHIY